MNRFVTLRFIAAAWLFCIWPSSLRAQSPQDDWRWEGKELLGNFGCLLVGKDDLLYAGGTNQIVVLDRNLNFVRAIAGVGALFGLACDSQTNIYALEQNSIKVFNSTGALIRQWGSAGTENGQFNVTGNLGSIPVGGGGQQYARVSSALAIGQNGQAYLADTGNNRVQVFDLIGNHLATWAQSTNLNGTVDQLASIVVIPSGRLITGSYETRNGLFGGIELSSPVFRNLSSNGTVIRRTPNNYPMALSSVTVTPDGLIVTTLSDNDKGIWILSPYFGPSQQSGVDGWPLRWRASANGTPTMGLPSAVYSNGSQDALYGMSFNSRGELFAAHSMRSSVDVNMQLNGIRVYSRRFFADRPLNPRELPQPVIVNRAQRPGTTLVDIDYKVVDADSATVHVAMLGFTNGSMDVPDLVLMTNFVENSFTNLGTGIPANQIRRVTWNLATDWNVGFGTFDIHVMAKDERGLFPFRFIQVPASGGDPAIFVSEKELTNPDLNNSWLWLIATGDPAIRLTNGEVFGVGGAYDNQRLTFSNVTTPPGRAFLYQRFGVRAATAADATRANAGRYGFPPRLDLVNNVATPTVTTDFVVKLP